MGTIAENKYSSFARKLHHSQFTDLIGCLKHNGKGMWFECEQPFLSGERCVISRKTAAKETTAKFVVCNMQGPFLSCPLGVNLSVFYCICSL